LKQWVVRRAVNDMKTKVENEFQR